MGPAEGKPTVYHWPVYLHVLRMVPFLLLLLLLARKSNRTRQTWWILPALILPLVFNWWLTKSGLTQQVSFLNESYLTFIVAMTILWLLSDSLVNISRLRTLVKVAAIFVLIGIFNLFSDVGLDMSLFSRGFNTIFAYALLSLRRLFQ